MIDLFKIEIERKHRPIEYPTGKIFTKIILSFHLTHSLNSFQIILQNISPHSHRVDSCCASHLANSTFRDSNLTQNRQSVIPLHEFIVPNLKSYF